MWNDAITILGLASLTNLFIHSEPTTWLRFWIYNKIWKKDYDSKWHFRLLNCALCSGFWIGLITGNLLYAGIISICAELISQKLINGKLW